MIETDAPYILPRNMPRSSHRRNEPAYLRWVLTGLAEARGVRPENLERTTDDTARAFFNLK
jgi:TatD DNase family protein